MLATLIQVKYKYTGQIISNIKIVKYSGWSLLIALLAPILMYFDRFYVSMNVEYSDLPIYSLPHEYIPKFVLITTAFSTALLPYFALNNNNAGAYNEFKKIFKKISIILIAPHILLFILSYLYFSHYIDENFANKIFPLLIIFNLSAYVNSLSSVAYNFVLSYNSIDDIAKNYIYQIILYIPILFFLYNLLGFSGAAIAYLLRNFLDLHMLLKNAKNNH